MISRGLSPISPAEVIELKFDTYHLDLLNKLWERVRMLPGLLKLADKTIREVLKLPEEYGTPFNYGVLLENYISRIEEDMIIFVAFHMTKDLNLTVDMSSIIKHFQGRFDAFEVANYIESKYLSRADEIALKRIRSNVRSMIPPDPDIYDDPEKIMEKILEKNKLVLHCYLEAYGFHEPVNKREVLDSIADVFKFAKIVLEGKPPSTVKAEEVYSAYSAYRSDFFEKKEFWGPIVAVKVYKNGNIRFWFRNEKDAKEVARAIVYGLTEDTQTQSKLSEYLEKTQSCQENA